MLDKFDNEDNLNKSVDAKSVESNDFEIADDVDKNADEDAIIKDETSQKIQVGDQPLD